MNADYGQLAGEIQTQVAGLDKADFCSRFWAHDGTLWKSDAENIDFIRKFMGWTDIANRMEGHGAELHSFAKSVWDAGFEAVLVCGMGGSSLCSLVLSAALPSRLPIHVLDSTSPTTVKRLRETLPLEKTLFLVASKSGTTVEPKSFEDYFFAELQAAKGDKAGENFVAITDPGSLMEAESKKRGYRKIFLGIPEIGGRYSVLSVFGMVTAALMGLDTESMWAAARAVGPVTGQTVAGSDAFSLGAALGVLAQHGRDKLTFVTSCKLESFGLWAEQLIAESTGKEGLGILPLAMEPRTEAAVYGKDRVFVGVSWGSDAEVDAFLATVEKDHPVIRRSVQTAEDLASEFFTWEIVTATASAVLGVNPFDQPNVQLAKEIAQGKLNELKETGALPNLTPDIKEGSVSWTGGSAGSLRDALGHFLSQAGEGGHIGLLAFVPEAEATTAAFQAFRKAVLNRTHAATSFGYGPRYLHSTGQFHKGGTNNGLFLVFTGGESDDLALPGQAFGFGALKGAQALGDIDALRQKGRTVAHVDLGADVPGALRDLAALIR